MDRISNLPNEIICHVLSFLSAKEAAFATVLSKRWRNLFTIIQMLQFDDSEGSFDDFVHLVLALPVSSRVRTFSLKCKNVSQYEDHISRCLSHVVKLGVLVLNLQIKVTEEGCYSLPFEVFTCKTVSTMKLVSGFEINPPTMKPGFGFVIDALPADVFLPALKSLFLDCVRFYGFDGRCSFQTLLAASPVLEELVIDGVEWERWKWCGTVSSTTLRRLTIQRRMWQQESRIFEIIRLDSRGLAYEFDTISFDTPGLTYLEYSDYVPKEYPIVNLNSLVEANLDLHAEDNGIWNSGSDTFNPVNLINGIKNVETLNLTSDAVEMFSVFSESIPVFEKVSQITLGLINYCWVSLPILMKKFPNLKTLIIEHSMHHGYREDGLSENSLLLSCPVEVLKINEYSGSTGELEQMKYLLASLSCLELVEVRARATSVKKRQIKSDLLMLPRASTKCKIEVKFFRSVLRRKLYTV